MKAISDLGVLVVTEVCFAHRIIQFLYLLISNFLLFLISISNPTSSHPISREFSLPAPQPIFFVSLIMTSQRLGASTESCLLYLLLIAVLRYQRYSNVPSTPLFRNPTKQSVNLQQLIHFLPKRTLNPLHHRQNLLLFQSLPNNLYRNR